MQPLVDGVTSRFGATPVRNDIPYVYVLIRTDIPVEHQVTQACHAALEVGFDNDRPSGHPVHLVTLAVESSDELLHMQHRLDIAGIGNHLFFEPDMHNGVIMGHTALASAPVSGRRRKLFTKYPLWDSQKACPS